MSSSQPAWVIDVDQAAFERAVLERSRELAVVVDFWAPWCGPCQALGPMLEKLVQERQGAILLAKVNIDEAQELAARYRVEAIPAVKAFRDGQPVLGFVGLLPEPQLREFLDRICPTEADRLVRQAVDLEVSNPAEAEALCRSALEADRNHEAATVGLARLLLNRGEENEAGELLARLSGGVTLAAEVERLEAILFLHRLGRSLGTEAEARQRLKEQPANPQYLYELGCILAAAGRYADALAQLLAAAEGDRKLAGSQVREAMVKIFQVIGVRDPRADEYRDKLSRLLY